MSAAAPDCIMPVKRRRVIMISSRGRFPAQWNPGRRSKRVKAIRASTRCRPSSRAGFQRIGDPVPHIVYADRDIVDLAMMKAAFLAVEHLEGLVFGADRGERLLGQRQGDLLIAGAVEQEERAGHLLHDAVEPEPFEL